MLIHLVNNSHSRMVLKCRCYVEMGLVSCRLRMSWHRYRRNCFHITKFEPSILPALFFGLISSHISSSEFGSAFLHVSANISGLNLRILLLWCLRELVAMRKQGPTLSPACFFADLACHSSIFQKESLRMTFPWANSSRSTPRTSMSCPDIVAPVSVHSETPKSPQIQCRSSP